MIQSQQEKIVQYLDSVPTPAWPWRLPIIRHVRYVINVWRVNRHYDFWLGIGQLPLNSYLDYAVCDAIWRGEK